MTKYIFSIKFFLYDFTINGKAVQTEKEKFRKI